MRLPTRRDTLGLVVSLVLAFGAATIGGAVTQPAVETWYVSLDKPSWTPPNAVFGPVWGLLYAAMAVAAWRVWRAAAGLRPARGALSLYGVQLALNVGWSLAFFGLESPGLGLAVIIVLWAAILATLLAFRPWDRPAAWLFVPYIAWVTYAGALNAAIWWMAR